MVQLHNIELWIHKFTNRTLKLGNIWAARFNQCKSDAFQKRSDFFCQSNLIATIITYNELSVCGPSLQFPNELRHLKIGAMWVGNSSYWFSIYIYNRFSVGPSPCLCFLVWFEQTKFFDWLQWKFARLLQILSRRNIGGSNFNVLHCGAVAIGVIQSFPLT